MRQDRPHVGTPHLGSTPTTSADTVQCGVGGTSRRQQSSSFITYPARQPQTLSGFGFWAVNHERQEYQGWRGRRNWDQSHSRVQTNNTGCLCRELEWDFITGEGLQRYDKAISTLTPGHGSHGKGPRSVSFTCGSNIQLIFNCPFYCLSIKRRENPILGDWSP